MALPPHCPSRCAGVLGIHRLAGHHHWLLYGYARRRQILAMSSCDWGGKTIEVRGWRAETVKSGVPPYPVHLVSPTSFHLVCLLSSCLWGLLLQLRP